MRRVVVTGIGIVSCLGNTKASVLEHLSEGKSGICFAEDYAEKGFRSLVKGNLSVDVERIPRKTLRFMSDTAIFSYLAMLDAIEDAQLAPEQYECNQRAGLIVGSGGASTSNVVESADILRDKGIRKVGPYRVTRTMGSTASACLATPFKIHGVNYSISSACSTGAHCVGNAMEIIQLGKQDIIFAGAGEELDWTLSMMFDAMGALSSEYNDQPTKASRAYDKDRDGFVISGGSGIVVLEEMEHAIKRGAPIYAELVGYGATSDGYDMVQPSGDGAVRCMQQALSTYKGSIDYINAHGTSTVVGDVKELQAVKSVFGANIPPLSSTKSMTGHSLGASGVQEFVYSVLMMDAGFGCESINIDTLDPEAEGFPILREKTPIDMNAFMSNSFGFGGTNATLIAEKFKSD